MKTPGGPAIVLALVLAEAAIGGLAVLWLVPLWGNVRNAFYKLVGAVIVVFAALSWLAVRDPLLGAPAAAGSSAPLRAVAPGAARTGVALLAAFAVATFVWQVFVWTGPRAIARVAALTAIPVGVAALVAIGTHPAAHASAPVAIFQLLAGAVFIGSVIDGLLLGHWHLVDRKLARRPLYRTNQFFLAGCALAAVAAIAGGTGAGVARSDLSPLLGVGVLTVSIAVGLAALCALIGFFIRALVRESSLQSATGLFYLGVIMGFASEFAAKVRFF